MMTMAQDDDDDNDDDDDVDQDDGQLKPLRRVQSFKKHLRTATGLVCPAHDDELNGLLLLRMQ